MSLFTCLFADTAKRRFEHHEFIIEESIHGWEWTHQDYDRNGISGTCQTVFEAIEAAEEWHREHPLTSLGSYGREMVE